MKKIIIVNNNMKVGGVQKSLYNLLWTLADQYDFTLYLFSKTGSYVDKLPDSVKVVSCSSLFRYLGVSQADCKQHLLDRLTRGFLAALCRIFGRAFVLRLISYSQKQLPDEYDTAIAFLHNGNLKSFYGGVNEFVLSKIKAKQKVAFLHCDYGNCGANNRFNNRLYYQFDRIVACSDGCRKAFLTVVPTLSKKCVTIPNFHRYAMILQLSREDPVTYQDTRFHLLIVGRLAHEKAIDRAIRAVAFAVECGLRVSLHIIGDGKMKTSLKRLAVELGIVDYINFHGEQINPYRFMVNADLLLLTSYHEAAPMVIDEARAVGLPVLTVSTTSSWEMVEKRHCGWICDNSQKGLNEALIRLLNNPESLYELKIYLKKNEPDNFEAKEKFRVIFGESNENRTT